MIILFNLKKSGNIFYNLMFIGIYNIIKLIFILLDFILLFKFKVLISDCLFLNFIYLNFFSFFWLVGSLILIIYN